MDDEVGTEMGVREWALALRETHGKLTPEIVREAARPEDSPAHGFVFNAPTDQAAEEYYLTRAHKLIQSVRIVVQRSPDEPPRRVRFFYAVPGEADAFTYEPLTVILSSPEKFEEARRAAVRRLRDAETAVEDLDVLASDPATRTQTRQAVAAVKTARVLIGA